MLHSNHSVLHAVLLLDWFMFFLIYKKWTWFLRYSDGGTFIVTNIAGSKASFSFNGTDIYIFGAKR